MFQLSSPARESGQSSHGVEVLDTTEKGAANLPAASKSGSHHSLSKIRTGRQMSCATTFLTQLQVIFGREWKILRRSVCRVSSPPGLMTDRSVTASSRDKTLFFTHIAVAACLGVFCGEDPVSLTRPIPLLIICLMLCISRRLVFPYRHHNRRIPISSRMLILLGKCAIIRVACPLTIP